MRLTKAIKESIIDRVMDDIPKVDYDAEVRRLVTNDIIKQLPRPVFECWSDPELRGYIDKGYYTATPSSGYSNRGVDGTRVRCIVSVMAPSDNRKIELSESVKGDVTRLMDKYLEQELERVKIRHELEINLSGITTAKRLTECFPEFTKYLPTPVAKCNTLPATTELMDNLRKAGWRV